MPLRGYKVHALPADPQLIPLATETSDGLMSSEDKTKLDGLSPSGAGLTLRLTTVSLNARLNDLVVANPSNAAVTITLPVAALSSGWLAVKGQSNSPNAITVAQQPGDTVDGQAAVGSLQLFGRQWVWLYSDGISDWLIISGG